MTDQRYTIFDYRLCNLYSTIDTSGIILRIYSITVTDKMAAKLFSYQNKSSSNERDSLTVQYALGSVQYAENIAWLLQCKVNGNLLYILCVYDAKITILKHRLYSPESIERSIQGYFSNLLIKF